MEYEQVPLESGWIEHDGSGVPEAIKRLPPETFVDVIKRGGLQRSVRAKDCGGSAWCHWPDAPWGPWDCDIMRYRILDQAAAQEPASCHSSRVPTGTPVAAAPVEWMPTPLPVRQKRDPWRGYVVTVGCAECAWGKVAGCWRCGSRSGSEPQGALQVVADPDRRGALWGAR